MQQRKVPMRRCIGCMASKPKKECLRICRTPEGELKVDVTGKLNGRGAYICRDAACFEKMVKGRKLNKEFEMQIPDSVYADLKEQLENSITDKTVGDMSITAAGGGTIE